MTPTPETPATDAPAPRGNARVVVASVLVTVAAIAFTALVPHARALRLWGFNHLAFYPLPVRLGALVLVVVSMIPPVSRAIYAGVLRIPAALGSGGSRSGLVVGVISLVSIVGFYHFHAATYLLGDGQLLVQSFEAAEKGNQRVLMRDVSSIMHLDQISRGTTLLYYESVKAARHVFKRSTVEGLRVLPCLLGGVFVFFLLRMVCSSALPSALRAWLLVLGVFTTSLQVFFGYIENYAVLFVLLGMYACAAFLSMRRRAPLWVPVVLLILAVFAHVQAILFAPSLVFLAAWRLALGMRRVVLRYGVPVLATATVAITLVARALNIPGDFYLPVFADAKSYGILTPGHLLDILNEFLMLLPVIVIVAAMGWAGRRSTRGASEHDWFTQSVETHFVALMIIPCIVYMVFFKSEIGMARDWDLFTMTSVGLIPLALVAIVRYSARDDDNENAARSRAVVFAPTMVILAVMSVSWIGVNASADRTTERFESVLAYDQTHAGYAYENLATYYHSAGQLAKAIRVMEIGARVSSNPRLYARLAVYYQENGDVASGVTILEDVLSKHPEHEKVRAKLIDLLEKSNDWPELVEVARGGVQYHPTTPIFFFALGEGLIRTGKPQEGLDVFRTCLTLNPPEGARQHIERRMKEFGQTP